MAATPQVGSEGTGSGGSAIEDPLTPADPGTYPEPRAVCTVTVALWPGVRPVTVSKPDSLILTAPAVLFAAQV